jgi:hypothetical protein
MSTLVVDLFFFLGGGGKVQQCGRWCHHVFCGVFRGKEMIEVLRTARGRLVEIKLFYSILFTFGQLRLTILICFIFMIFFFIFCLFS